MCSLDAFVRRDYEGVLSLCDEDIEITQAAGFAGFPENQRGHAGVFEASRAKLASISAPRRTRCPT